MKWLEGVIRKLAAKPARRLALTGLVGLLITVGVLDRAEVRKLCGSLLNSPYLQSNQSGPAT